MSSTCYLIDHTTFHVCWDDRHQNSHPTRSINICQYLNRNLNLFLKNLSYYARFLLTLANLKWVNYSSHNSLNWLWNSGNWNLYILKLPRLVYVILAFFDPLSISGCFCCFLFLFVLEFLHLNSCHQPLDLVPPVLPPVPKSSLPHFEEPKFK